MDGQSFMFLFRKFTLIKIKINESLLTSFIFLIPELRNVVIFLKIKGFGIYLE